MESGKTPGIDGLPVEFYKEFWAVLNEDLLAVLNESLVDGSLPLSCRRAVITLLPKKGDLQEIKNWRPVSLLCSDFKILSKTLANRLRKVMGQVIHLDQTYCVPGRSITHNVCLIQDVLSVSSLLGVNLGLISIDQEKAFNRVEHQYLWDTLEAFNFRPGFINMIKVLYQDTESLLKINGGLSAPFKVSRGIRQGCALSGMLYSLSIEPLLNNLRSRIKGLLLQHGIEHQISAYADDVVVMINGQQDINQLVFIVNDFRKISSAKVNWEKSEALAVGKWEKGLPNLPGGMIWRKEGFKYLGVYLGDSNIQQKNWEGVIDKVEGKLKKWKWIHLPSRHATFRLQFIQRFLTGPLDLVWRKMAEAILHTVDGLGLDAGLFLMDVKQLRLAGLPQFYCGLFKVWGLFNVCRLEGIQSLHWLLEEPLIKGARMDIAGGSFPGLMQILCSSKLVTLKHLVDVAGPELSDINAVAAFLGQKSARHTTHVDYVEN
uniref:Reverse transcriptase domain-containing protein n=1 Tax=Cyprinus carpio carpio TaxID=630221 RepID=A0A9J8BR89_CYPCA